MIKRKRKKKDVKESICHCHRVVPPLQLTSTYWWPAWAGVRFRDRLLLPGYIQCFLVIQGAPASASPSKMLASACCLQGWGMGYGEKNIEWVSWNLKGINAHYFLWGGNPSSQWREALLLNSLPLQTAICLRSPWSGCRPGRLCCCSLWVVGAL